MNTLTADPDLPVAVTRLTASVVGLSTRRHRGSCVLWRAGVVVGSASALWRSSTVALVLPDGEQVQGEVRGVDGGTDLAAVTLSGGSLPVAERTPAAASRVGDFVFAVVREPSGLTQASFGHVGMVGGERRTWRGGRVETLIRFDGGLYPGLAGAPVADATGQVLGVASSAFSRHHGVVLPVAHRGPCARPVAGAWPHTAGLPRHRRTAGAHRTRWRRGNRPAGQLACRRRPGRARRAAGGAT